MGEQRDHFRDRIKRLEKTDRKSKRADVYRNTGIMHHKERERREANKFRMPWKYIISFAVLLFLGMSGVKGYMAETMGAEAYDARIAELQAGTSLERMFSYALKRGPGMSALDGVIANMKGG